MPVDMRTSRRTAFDGDTMIALTVALTTLAVLLPLSLEAQQLMVDWGGLRSFHALVKDKPSRKPLKEIKLMKDDPVAVEKQADEIKTRYSKIFNV